MTKLEMIDHLSFRLSEDTILILDDFFSVTMRDEGVSLSFMSREHSKVSFGEVVKSIKAMHMFSFIKDFECKWNEEHDWYEVKYTMKAGKDYTVEITLH